MEIYRVSFIGHREVDDFFFVEDQVDSVVRELISAKEYVEFYVGRNGEFDTLVASVIKRVKREIGEHNSSLILVIPYPVADIEAKITMTRWSIQENFIKYTISLP